MLTAIFTSVTGALLVAAIFWVFKSRWLYVIAPKLHMITPISDGQVVSLSLFNAGLLSEEEIALTMRPACRFELLGASKSTVDVQGKIISLPKLARLETVTVLLLVEGKPFEQEDIESIESKATVGKVVVSKDKATSAWQNIIALPIVLFVLFLPIALGTLIGAEMHQSIFGYILDKYELIGPSKQLAGYKQATRSSYGNGKLEKALDQSLVNINVQEIVRRGDVLTLAVDIKNNSGSAIIAEGSVKGTAGTGNLSFTDSRFESLALANGETKKVKMQVFLPEANAAKIVEGTYRFDSIDAGYLNVTQIIQFD